MDTRKWYKITDKLPARDGVEVYYFTKSNRLLKGTYNILSSSYSDVYKFRNEVDGLINSELVSHWMEYDRIYQNVLPLPPEFSPTEKVDIEKTKQKITVSTSLARKYWYGNRKKQA